MPKIIGQSATTLARQIRRGALTPTEVVGAHLDRIETVDDEINAFVTLNDSARARAREATAAVESGEALGRLHGVPVAVKDLSNTAGLRTTMGSALLAENVPEGSTRIIEARLIPGVVSLHPLEPKDSVLDNLVEHMSHVWRTGEVGWTIEKKEPFISLILFSNLFLYAVFLPELPYFLLHLFRIVFLVHLYQTLKVLPFSFICFFFRKTFSGR